ncbi:HAD family hydrolase [Lacticaseibacillus kribbianus]|uniref:HAD family hydrolase n=1 Tax=Lacticaseibacillus kribbianus TaxID=2926292 RepID=UPI001CD7AFD4|nr:HAD family phosphatase [Lacticaseibacillus kribbianus]
MKKRAVLFDLDGVLIDSEPLYYKWRKAQFDAAGVHPARFSLAETAGVTDDAFWLQAFPTDAALRTAQRRQFEADVAAHPVPFSSILKPGVAETLAWLPAHGYRTALVSAGAMPDLLRFVAECDLHFDRVISGSDLAANKPDPLIYRTALEALALPASACLAIEDSQVGIAAATGAGIETWAVRPDGYALDQRGADRIIAGVKALPELLG